MNRARSIIGRYARTAVRARVVAGVVLLAVVSILAYALWPRESILVRCARAEYRQSCYDDAIRTALASRGINAAFDLLSEIYNADPSFIATCHAETHVLGEEAYREFHATGKVALSNKAAYCGFGFYHGFMDQLVYQTKNFAEARKFCAYIGAQLPTPPGYSEGACYHGIGHGVTDGTDPGLWGDAARMAAPGLALCEKVADGDRDHLMRCTSGVFNAIALDYQDPKYKLHAANPFSLCLNSEYSGATLEACYTQMDTLAAYFSKYDFVTEMKSTLVVPEGEARRWAIRGVGETYFSTQRSLKEPVSGSEVSRACGIFASSEDADMCISSVVGGIQEYGTPGAEYTDMLAFCSQEDVAPSLVGACYREALTHTRLFYGAAKVREICERVPARYRTADCGD